jgi:hypothetical protein
MPNRLLDRQVSLLEYLTSAAAIFGEDGGSSAVKSVAGIKKDLLHLEARFSFEKRMAKVRAVLPRTMALLAGHESAVAREFAQACPPTDMGLLANARAFHGFLCDRSQRAAPGPPYLPDVAACELACGEARVAGDETTPRSRIEPASQPGIRRGAGVVLLRCAYDVRPIFEAGGEHATPVPRDTPLAVAMSRDADAPGVVELVPALYEMLAALDDWVDPSQFAATEGFPELLGELTAFGLIEVRA